MCLLSAIEGHGYGCYELARRDQEFAHAFKPEEGGAEQQQQQQQVGSMGLMEVPVLNNCRNLLKKAFSDSTQQCAQFCCRGNFMQI